jgi:hypothetical protein
MFAAVATLAFLATLWLLVVLGASVLGESGAKIAAALKGRSPFRLNARMAPVPARVTSRSRANRPMRARPRWRDAA